MDLEKKTPELGQYGFQLNFHVVRNRPWSDAAIEAARTNPDLPPGASDLEAVAKMIADVCGNVLEMFGDECFTVLFDAGDRPEGN